mmetsp:Transcript_4724/g.21552  ORF Transcript_4724/g.21552 Transcript_4724/m.21552 type:complete len:367 (-) Transcript_4724:762-1862(-)
MGEGEGGASQEGDRRGRDQMARIRNRRGGHAGRRDEERGRQGRRMAGGHAGHRAGKPGGEHIQDSRPPRGRPRRDRERQAVRRRQLCLDPSRERIQRTLRRRRHPRVARDQHRGRDGRRGVLRGRPRGAHAQERQTHGAGGLFRRRRGLAGARTKQRQKLGKRLAGCARRGDGTRRRRLERRVGSRSSSRSSRRRAGSRSSRHRAGESPPVPPRTRERHRVLRAKGEARAEGRFGAGERQRRTRRPGAADPPANRLGRREADVLAPARRVRRRRASRARRAEGAARAPSPERFGSVVRRVQPKRRSRVVEVRDRRGDVTYPRGGTRGGTSVVVVSRRRGGAGNARAARVRRVVRSKRNRSAPEAYP